MVEAEEARDVVFGYAVGVGVVLEVEGAFGFVFAVGAEGEVESEFLRFGVEVFADVLVEDLL